MRYNFKNIFMSLVYKNTNEQLLNSLKEYNIKLLTIKEDLSSKLNRLKYLCLNSKNLSNLLDSNLSKININNLIDAYILDDIHLININYPSDDKIIEQLFISNTLIQSIEKNCIVFNKYVNIIKNIRLFLCNSDINSDNISSPYFKFFKNKKGFPMAFICLFTTEYLFKDFFTFNIYGFIGDYILLHHSNDYIELVLEYKRNYSNSLELKKLCLGNTIDCGDLAIKYLTEDIVPELNNLITCLMNQNNSQIDTVYTQVKISEDFNKTLDFYTKNGFTFSNNNFYLNIFEQ